MNDYETTNVDARERVDAIEDRMAEIEAEARETKRRQEDLQTKLDGADSADDEVDVEALQEDLAAAEQDYVTLAEEFEELEATRDELEAKFEQWGGSEYTIRKLGFIGEGQVDDLVRSDMIRDNENDPRTKLSALKVRTIQVGTVSSPPEAPDDPRDPGFPAALGEWLYERIDNFNRFGETSIEDFSLSRRLAESSDDTPS